MQALEAPSPTTPSSALVPVASDSLYCRDAAFWRGYCRHWGELENSGCERIATCQDGEPTSVAVIVSDTAWVAADPSAHGWLRLPPKDPSRFRQRWIHPHYVPWNTPQAYEEPLPPEQLGLVEYPFRGSRFLRILYGFPFPPSSLSTTFNEVYSYSDREPETNPPDPEPPTNPSGLHGHVHVKGKGCQLHWHEWTQLNLDHGCPDYSNDPCGAEQDSNGKHTGDISEDGRCGTE